MKKIIALYFIAAMPLAALDLMPIETVKNLEGFRIPVLQFRDGSRTAQWQPPAGWRFFFADNRLQFAPKSPELSATFEMWVMPVEPKPQTPEEMPALSQALLPKSFTEIVAGQIWPSPFTLGTVETTEYTFTALSIGRKIGASVILAQLNPKQRLVCILYAPEKDYTAVRADFLASLNGWTWLD